MGINDADYATSKYGVVGGKYKLVWRCPFYSVWSGMINRCYRNGGAAQYKDVDVCQEWHTFSNFKLWMKQQDWKGNELDKDLFGDGKIYSPTTCCFLPAHLNILITESRKNNTNGIPNVRALKNGFSASVSTQNGIVSESFPTLMEAVDFWIDAKIAVVATCEDVRVKEKLLERYERLRERYLSNTDCPLSHRVVTQNTIEEFEKQRKKIKVGDTLCSSNGYPYVVLRILGGDVLIRFENGKERKVSVRRIKEGTIRFRRIDEKLSDIPDVILTQIKKIRLLNKYGYPLGVFKNNKYYCVSWNRKMQYFKTLDEASLYIRDRRVEKIKGLCELHGIAFESLNILKDG